MAPIEGQMMMAPPGPGPGVGTIPLSTLMDYIIQRTYHELNVLSELLPRKTDMERKIEIVQFASRTRQLFVRLLALVKWANSAGKVDKCTMIASFLDQQALFFVETADKLASMARDTLLQARLPCFSIPCAIDVLTTGTYPRLPACIKEKIVPPDPITHQEKQQTLLKLNQIIEHRLVTGELPSHMRRPVIENGRVKFQVRYEFEVTLTLMGDGPNIPWRLLDIEILVEDPETGDGIALVHSLQVNYIHELLQSRLMDNEHPLHDLYNVLHSFCQSLQLEVLHSQAQRLIHQRLGDNVRIEEYIPGKSMIISYWRDSMKKESRPFQQIYKLNIQVDENDPSKPLQISHFPQIQGSESTKVAQAIRSDHLSLEKLLIHTIQVRGLCKLKELERELRLIVPGPCETRDLPTVLYVPVLYPCMESERLSIAIDVQRGNFLVSLCLKETNLTADIQESINSDKRELRRLLSKLRLWIALQRCQKSIQHISTTCLEHLPFTNLSGHPLEAVGNNKLFVKLPKQINYYLVVEATETYKRCVDYKYYMLEVQACPYLDGTSDEETESMPKMYVKAGHLVELEKFACTHGSGAKIHDVEAEDPNPLTRKRKLFKKDNSGLVQKKTRGSSYFVPELPHILALCEDRLPFVLLGRELDKKGIAYSDIEVDGEGIGLSLSVLGLIPCEGLREDIQEKLRSSLLCCKFRIQRKGSRPSWILEAVFCNPPLQGTNPKESGPVQRIFFGYDLSGPDAAEKPVQGFIDDWISIANLYQLVSQFGEIYNENERFMMELEIKNYTYKRLLMAYGPNKCYTATVCYKGMDKKDPKAAAEKKFNLTLGTHGQINIANCHMITANHLEQVLNEKKSLAYLGQLLIDTWAPMCSIGKLTTTPMVGVTNRQNQAIPGFSYIPQSATHVRIVFRETYCLDVHCRGNRVAAVRDGAYSMFDTSKVVEPLIPIPGLKAFLNLFVDESMNTSQSRRRSTTEDDHPPSPSMDTLDGFMGSSHPSGSPVSKGLTFKSPLTPPSNPTTPASPAGSKLPHHSPAGNFPLASPPSLGPAITPSPSNMMAPSPGGNPSLHVPSPGSFVPAPSPSSLGIHMPSPATQFISPQGMLEGSSGGSPFPTANLAMPSPGTKNWPASPSVPGPSPRTHAVTSPPQAGPGSMMSPPSRILPQRSWAASIPTLLSHDAFDKLLSPSKLPGNQWGTHMLSPLERFLSCVFLRRHIQRVVQSDDNLQQMQSTEAGVVLFKVEGVQYKVSLNTTHMQCLTLKVTPSPECQSQWDTEELQLLEKFFETKAASSPYKANAITAFSRLLTAPLRVLKDFIQIMKLELYPSSNMKWSVQWCLTIPSGAPLCTEVGVAAVVLREKSLFVLQLTYLDPPQGKDPEVVVVPVLYIKANNETTLVDQHDPKTNMAPPSQTLLSIKEMFRKFHQFHLQKPNECSIFPAVSEVLTNLNCSSAS